MDESDSDRDEPVVRDENVPYPIEGKYIDEADRRRILNMPQLERERILGERAEESQDARFKAELQRRAKQRDLETAQNEKKRKANLELQKLH